MKKWSDPEYDQYSYRYAISYGVSRGRKVGDRRLLHTSADRLFDTPEEAFWSMRLLAPALKLKLGVTDLAVCKVRCWPHGEAVGIYAPRGEL